MMCLLKIARMETGDKENPDHLLDIAGYSILASAIKDKDNQ